MKKFLFLFIIILSISTVYSQNCNNIVANDGPYKVGDTGPPLTQYWFYSSSNHIEYTKVCHCDIGSPLNGVVYMNGTIMSEYTVSGANIYDVFTLPQQYRPRVSFYFSIFGVTPYDASLEYYIVVTTNGSVKIGTTRSQGIIPYTVFYLPTITYLAEQ